MQEICSSFLVTRKFGSVDVTSLARKNAMFTSRVDFIVKSEVEYRDHFAVRSDFTGLASKLKKKVPQNSIFLWMGVPAI